MDDSKLPAWYSQKGCVPDTKRTDHNKTSRKMSLLPGKGGTFYRRASDYRNTGFVSMVWKKLKL